MANLQAIGFDNNTVIYLLAEGSGTDLDPYISKYKLVDQDLLAKDATLAAIADKLPQLALEGDRLMVATSGTVALDTPTLTAISDLIPTFTFDGTRLTVETGLDLSLLATDVGLAAIADKIPVDLSTVGGRLLVDAGVILPSVFTVEGMVSTGLEQSLTLAELQSVIVNVSEQSPLDLSPLAKEVTLAAIANAIPEFTFDGVRLTVKTELDQPLTLAQLESAIAQIKEGLANQFNQEAANTLLDAIKNKIPTLTFSDSRLNVATGLNQPLTLAQLQGLTIATQEQNPLDISALASQVTLAALNDKIALDGDRIKVDIGVAQGLTNGELRAEPLEVTFDFSDFATKTNQNTTNSTLSTLSTKIPPGLTVFDNRLLVETGILQGLTNAQLRSDPVAVTFDLSTLATKLNQDTTNTRLGDVIESPPTNDTASSGLNGRLQRIAQRITTLIGLLPSSLGAKTAANSFPVTLASDGVASGIANQIGEVQSSPTANTVLDRLKAIVTAVSSPTTYTVTTICLTTALSEGSLSLSGVKKIACYSRTNTIFRISTTAGNTVNTQNFEIVQSGNEYYQDDINFTGTLYFSAESLPTAITVASCSTTNGGSTVTSSNSFSSLTIGQAVSGTGIPANTFVIRRAADGLSITLGDANGNTVNATANGTVTLTFSGAVIRISRWT